MTVPCGNANPKSCGKPVANSTEINAKKNRKGIVLVLLGFRTGCLTSNFRSCVAAPTAATRCECPRIALVPPFVLPTKLWSNQHTHFLARRAQNGTDPYRPRPARQSYKLGAELFRGTSALHTCNFPLKTRITILYHPITIATPVLCHAPTEHSAP
eukprot:981865-Rhodomonas_salina.4